ncbi:MAG: hypothetical protein ACREU2_10030 [Steroidobacteraceae bacterium]
MRSVAFSARNRDTSASSSLTERRAPALPAFTSRGDRTQAAILLPAIL